MIKYHYDLIQGTEEWLEARRGLLCASEMKLIITPKELKYAKNDKEKSHLYELAAQRITKYIEPHYIGDDMMHGKDDEIDAKFEYEKHYSRITDVGFITNDKWGFTLGYSPDGLIDNDGAIECKGRRQKFQVQTITTDELPEEYAIQIQTGLLVSERKWMDFISYSSGMPMFTKRIMPDLKVQDAIIAAATIFHDKMDKLLKIYSDKLLDENVRLIPTERRVEKEMIL